MREIIVINIKRFDISFYIGIIVFFALYIAYYNFLVHFCTYIGLKYPDLLIIFAQIYYFPTCIYFIIYSCSILLFIPFILIIAIFIYIYLRTNNLKFKKNYKSYLIFNDTFNNDSNIDNYRGLLLFENFLIKKNIAHFLIVLIGMIYVIETLYADSNRIIRAALQGTGLRTPCNIILLLYYTIISMLIFYFIAKHKYEQSLSIYKL